ncbi:MAG: IclR family transcriptional regulator [Burkholderiaceae bacterium]|nr:IclR family transcriptional regulator [Burkholderiaceae bacterium]
MPAVDRAVRLIDALAASHEPLALAELARRLALPKSSVHGLLATLVAHGLARRNDDGEFSLGTRPLQWADAYVAQSDILRAFDANARRIAPLATETVMLAVLEGAEVLYLACRPGSRALAVNFRVGGRFPAAFTSSGKAMMASLPDEAVRALLAHQPFERPTRHSVSSATALLRQLTTVRKQGYATDDEETAEGMQCFGAPVYGPRRPEAVAAVAVSVIKAGLGARRRGELVASVRQLAQELSNALGAAPRRPAALAQAA